MVLLRRWVRCRSWSASVHGRQKYWGKRDVWAWLAFVVGVGQVLATIAVLLKVGGWQRAALGALVVPTLVMLGSARLSFSYWQGKRWARVAMFGLQLLVATIGGVQAVIALSRVGDADASALGEAVGAMVGGAMLPLGLGLILWFDGRNRLFFKIDIPRDKLQKLWELYMNNPVARAGYLLSFLSLVLGPVALLSVPLCIVGLRRVDPDSHPPQGRRGQAIAGLVLSGVGLAVFVALVVTLRA